MCDQRGGIRKCIRNRLLAEKAKDRWRSGALSKHDSPALQESAVVGINRCGKVQSLNQNAQHDEKAGVKSKQAARAGWSGGNRLIRYFGD